MEFMEQSASFKNALIDHLINHFSGAGDSVISEPEKLVIVSLLEEIRLGLVQKLAQ
jgi:hypothetical protein